MKIRLNDVAKGKTHETRHTRETKKCEITCENVKSTK